MSALPFSVVGVSVTGTSNVPQHWLVLSQINNPLYFTVLYLLVTLFVNPFFKVLQKGINNAGINKNKHIYVSQGHAVIRCN